MIILLSVAFEQIAKWGAQGSELLAVPIDIQWVHCEQALQEAEVGPVAFLELLGEEERQHLERFAFINPKLRFNFGEEPILLRQVLNRNLLSSLWQHQFLTGHNKRKYFDQRHTDKPFAFVLRYIERSQIRLNQCDKPARLVVSKLSEVPIDNIDHFKLKVCSRNNDLSFLVECLHFSWARYTVLKMEHFKALYKVVYK